MESTDASRALHAFILLQSPRDGALPAARIGPFYAQNISAGSLIRRRGLKKFCLQNPRLLRWCDDPSPGLVIALQNAGAASGLAAGHVNQSSQAFFESVLRGQITLLRACEDREIFSLELQRWKEMERLEGRVHRVSPGSVIFALKSTKIIKKMANNGIDDGGVIIWAPEVLGPQLGESLPHQRIKEVASRVRHSRQQLEQNREDVDIGPITLGCTENGEVKTVRVGELQTQNIHITNNNMSPVIISIESNAARAKGLVIDGPSQLKVSGRGGHAILTLSFTPRMIGVMRCVFALNVSSPIRAFTPFAVVRYVSVCCGNPEDDEILK